ncbi:MAG: hypothetical protein LBD70_01430 [Bifidobacteriaceae bacterium]|jgi:hypothetical protein|nr:hypothetical protein [Bifidobacteriaceae bacterium]
MVTGKAGETPAPSLRALAVASRQADPASAPRKIGAEPVEVLVEPGGEGGGGDRGGADWLAACLDRRPADLVVAWAVDSRAVGLLRELADRRADLLVVSTLAAAEGVIAALRRGRSIASLVYPPPPAPRLALEQAGLGASAGQPRRWSVELADPWGGRDADWLRLTADGVEVRAEALRPLERAAIAERSRPPRVPRESGGGGAPYRSGQLRRPRARLGAGGQPARARLSGQ